jgi:hypothetical protein
MWGKIIIGAAVVVLLALVVRAQLFGTFEKCTSALVGPLPIDCVK